MIYTSSKARQALLFNIRINPFSKFGYKIIQRFGTHEPTNDVVTLSKAVSKRRFSALIFLNSFGKRGGKTYQKMPGNLIRLYSDNVSTA